MDISLRGWMEIIVTKSQQFKTKLNAFIGRQRISFSYLFDFTVDLKIISDLYSRTVVNSDMASVISLSLGETGAK